jgi:23S rRNA (cytidine1920-2'-O)/16S rRNA (cytidine1409-2'-O)-methyltransferase
MRADQLLLQRQLATSRSQAQRLIASGVRWRADAGADAPWKRIGKNSDELPADAQIDLLDAKLEGALRASGVVVTGKTCLDVGQSTGGFTDCLLQHGATLVVGVDVGSGQLHPALRANPQVLALEHINARELDASVLIAAYADSTGAGGTFDAQDDAEAEDEDGADIDADADVSFDASFDLIVGDLSFISQTLVLPALVPLLKPGADLLMLVKPQFELQPGQVGKGGIVKDAAMYAVVEQRIRDCCAGLGLLVVGWFDSPITGGDGNREFFVHAKKTETLP